ncbi:golgin subfamily A member 6-like protein 7 [Syngnathoides biaculeatus]|uniref:golgin subfamily A member 6-like protein 7 n=1 Tax=Syngnathoides biaculeatus TaxID=300417 RepID=UPI002ADE5670|nr:golgin subfamily A member 6-like protein 7 [Syngnathoides biaculeatus]
MDYLHSDSVHQIGKMENKSEDHNSKTPSKNKNNFHAKMAEPENFDRYLEQKKVQRAEAMTAKRADNLKLMEAILAQEQRVKGLELVLERQNLINENFRQMADKKLGEEGIRFDKMNRYKQMKNAEIDKLNEQIGEMKKEIPEIEDTLSKYERYKRSIYKLAASDHQANQHVLPDHEQVLERMENLREQNQFLLPYAVKNNYALLGQQQKFEHTRKKNQQNLENLRTEISTVKAKIEEERKTSLKISQMVKLYKENRNAELEKELESLTAKVTKVYRSCATSSHFLNPLKKMKHVEEQVFALMGKIDSIPKELLKKMQTNFYRKRLQEEEQRIQREREDKRLRRSALRSQQKAKIDQKEVRPKRVMVRYKVVTRPKAASKKAHAAEKKPKTFEDEIWEDVVQAGDGACVLLPRLVADKTKSAKKATKEQNVPSADVKQPRKKTAKADLEQPHLPPVPAKDKPVEELVPPPFPITPPPYTDPLRDLRAAKREAPCFRSQGINKSLLLQLGPKKPEPTWT